MAKPKSTLRADILSIGAQVAAGDADMTALRARVAELETALEPFAREADSGWDEDTLQNEVPALITTQALKGHAFSATFSFADIARARAARDAVRKGKDKLG